MASEEGFKDLVDNDGSSMHRRQDYFARVLSVNGEECKILTYCPMKNDVRSTKTAKNKLKKGGVDPMVYDLEPAVNYYFVPDKDEDKEDAS